MNVRIITVKQRLGLNVAHKLFLISKDYFGIVELLGVYVCVCVEEVCVRLGQGLGLIFFSALL